MLPRKIMIIDSLKYSKMQLTQFDSININIRIFEQITLQLH